MLHDDENAAGSRQYFYLKIKTTTEATRGNDNRSDCDEANNNDACFMTLIVIYAN